MAEKTFSQGQSVLAKIVNKHSHAGSRKNETLDQRRQERLQHSEKVKDKMLSSL